jgi:hypothetical protein
MRLAIGIVAITVVVVSLLFLAVSFFLSYHPAG